MKRQITFKCNVDKKEPRLVVTLEGSIMNVKDMENRIVSLLQRKAAYWRLDSCKNLLEDLH